MSFSSGNVAWSIIRALFNPATLLTFFAPPLIAVTEAFFRTDVGPRYLSVVQQEEVCGLLDHRTQLYTLIVAFAFFLLQTGAVAGKRLVTVPGNINLEKIKHDPFVGWYIVTMFLISVAFFVCMFSGRFMTPQIVDMYAALPTCVMKHVGQFGMPPLSSPITIFRAVIGGAALAITLNELLRKEDAH